jgi:poly [ADP-ribose] polymerase
MAIKERVRLVFSDLGSNSYKYWDGELHDDDTVVSFFGVVGAKNPQSKNFGKVGKAFFDKKIREKERKGYEHAKVILEGSNTQTVNKQSLADIAVKQIKFSNPNIESLIKRLANSNVHKISSSTSISFDNGIFQTPLGVVTQEGIDDARNLLQYFFLNVSNRKKIENDFNHKIDSYLKIIPRPKGGGLYYENIFNTKESIEKESDVLDALENSLSIVSTPKPDSGNKVIESIFDLELDIENDNKIRKDLEKWYESSKKSMHNYDRIKVKEIYKVNLPTYNRDFKESLGNIKQVFHGSGQANILSILKSGLCVSPPSTAAIAGKMFGCGTYGSETSSKSLGYSLGRWGQSSGDSGWLMICDFAMGNAYYPTSSLSSVPNGYDSCWALPQKTGLLNDELIVYRNDQVRIKYLIEVK